MCPDGRTFFFPVAWPATGGGFYLGWNVQSWCMQCTGTYELFTTLVLVGPVSRTPRGVCKPVQPTRVLYIIVYHKRGRKNGFFDGALIIIYKLNGGRGATKWRKLQMNPVTNSVYMLLNTHRPLHKKECVKPS
jgi:hypothetical protein